MWIEGFIIMQIKKINSDKLKVILSSNDLTEKNINVDSFLSNSIESQNLFFEILDLAEEKYDFYIDNNKAIVETISLDNNIFVLTITKQKNEQSIFSNQTSHIYRFEGFNDFLEFYILSHKENISMSNILAYKYMNSFFIVLDKLEGNKKLNNYLIEFSTPVHNSNVFNALLNEYGEKINKII